MKLKRHHRNVPDLQMASMPDLIFTILFFFMIVTHMREDSVKVRYEQPVGENLVKVTNKASAINIYIGRYADGTYRVQVGNNVVPMAELAKAIRAEREAVSINQMDYVSASLLADRQVPLTYINKVKMALRECKVLKITYTATSTSQAVHTDNGGTNMDK